MLIQKNRLIHLAATALIIGSFYGAQALAQANDDTDDTIAHTPPAHGHVNTILACEKSEQGWVVAFSDVTENSKFANAPAAGERCLPLLAQVPPSKRSEVPVFLNPNKGPNSNAAEEEPKPEGPETIDDCLSWVIEGPSVSDSTSPGKNFGVSGIVICDVDSNRNELITQFVDSHNNYTPTTNESCIDTLDALTKKGHRARPPVSVSRSGGSLYVKNGPRGKMEVVECGMNENGKPVTTYWEDQDGLMPVGESCLAAVSDQGKGSFKVSNPVAIPPGGFTNGPLNIWSIAGATQPVFVRLSKPD